MVKIESSIPIVNDQFIRNDPRSHFLSEIAKHPHIMISFKDGQFDTPISQLSKFRQEANITFRNDMLIFKPEIEYVTHQKDFFCIFLDIVEPGNYISFSFQTFLIRRNTQMKVGREIQFFTV